MEKYYTPDIEEFHVGFEFESRYTLFSRDKEWVKCKLDENNTWFTEEWYVDAVPTEFRVKYLDQEDIESLGFTQTKKDINGIEFKREDGLFLWWNSRGIIDIDTGGNQTDNISYFKGKLKNKSELKKVLKMIGYEG